LLETLSTLQDAETGERGFALSGSLFVGDKVQGEQAAHGRGARGGEGDMEPLIGKANECVDGTAQLTHSLLAFSRQQPLAPQVVDVDKLVAAITTACSIPASISWPSRFRSNN
jgi:hypothetical protein